MFTLLESGIRPSVKKGLLSPHGPADREIPAVAKLSLPRGAGKGSRYTASQVAKGPGRPTPIPAHLTRVQKRDKHEILPGEKWAGAVLPTAAEIARRFPEPHFQTPICLKSPFLHFFLPFCVFQLIVVNKPTHIFNAHLGL